MSNETLTAICIVLNAALCMICLLLRYEADNGTVRRGFFMTVFGYAIWMNSVLLFRMDFWADSVAILLSRLAFSGGAIATAAIGYFLLELAEYQDRRRWIQFGFYGLLGIAALSPFSGFVENGFGVENGLRKPLYGPLHPFYVGALLAGGIYFLVSAYLGYRRVQRELLQFQLRRILFASVVAFLGSAATNALLPAITGSSSFSVLGIFWPVALMGVIAHLLIQGRTMLAVSALRQLLNERIFRLEENLFGVRQYIEVLRFAVVDNPETFDRTVKLTNQKRESFAVHVFKNSRAELESSQSSLALDSVPPQVPGLINALTDLEKQNTRLVLALTRAESVLGQLPSSQPPRNQIAQGQIEEPDNLNLTPLEWAERRTIIEYLTKNRYNQAVTSRQIGIRPNTLINKMRKYAIKPPAGLVRPGKKPMGQPAP